MSDRRPLLAELRRQVESGTIKGTERKRCTVHRADYDEGAPGCVFWMFAQLVAQRYGTELPRPCSVDPVLVIPIPDEKEY